MRNTDAQPQDMYVIKIQEASNNHSIPLLFRIVVCMEF